jgi:hypothetical protein
LAIPEPKHGTSPTRSVVAAHRLPFTSIVALVLLVIPVTSRWLLPQFTTAAVTLADVVPRTGGNADEVTAKSQP